ncbi:CoA pyrophosphatase [Mycobacterium sp. CVI_P3]|uniref:CoA pyrophosphatase n=1 Tax=Mycobacterium pinniadriaticum TaxID=2994102 RepID=A0ABT3SJ90_9MYCO|nr:CoA pyrophosphatase [Mycobacterium pinniadriaticum]MCX2933109.1 CoA pyrophosphatase [Mycobacterium pinniadriaticum]MCX2939591.1 CoA pyrophosphatase [Mycobacterium pinniadriaticum]
MTSWGTPPQTGGAPTRSAGPVALTPQIRPPWLAPLVDNVDQVPQAYRRKVPPELLAAVTEAGVAGAGSRDAAVLVLFSGPSSPRAGGQLPDDVDLLLTVRAGTLRHHAGQAAFPGGAADPDDASPVHTALREAQEETGIDPRRLHPLATLERMFIPPSGFHVVPVLAYSPDPGPVGVVDEAETAIVARVPLRAFINPENRLMVYRSAAGRSFAGPAFLLNQMLVWGFTGHVISAMLDVAGWTQPWNTEDVRGLDEAIALVGSSEEPL